MESLEDCVCHGKAAKLHGNSYDETPRRAGIFRCPEGSAAKVLHPKSFADCACLSGFSRDDTHKACSSEDFRCMGRYQRKDDIVKAESIADCDCQVPYTKDEATGECALRECPRAGNYVEKSRRRGVTSLADCTCMEPFIKNDQSGECLVGEPFQCPPRSSPAKNTRAKSFADCHCEWGFVKNDMDECERESAAYICPRDSMKRPGIPIGERPRGFFDCECVQEGVLYRRNDFMQSCDEISPDGGAAKRQTPFECPPFAKPLAAIPHSVEQCECLEGYGWKTPEMVCVRMSTYKCPLHSYKLSDEMPVEETFDDCACTSGYYRDESLQKCIEWFLTNDNGCPKFSFLKHWPLQSKANCQCIYGFKEAEDTGGDNEELPVDGDDGTEPNKALLRQQRRNNNMKKSAALECKASPSMTMDDKFTFSECPQNAFATNWPLSGLDECSCLFGFNVAPISDEDLDHGDGELFQCLPSEEVDADEQALACRPPMVMNRFNGLCRLPLEEVKASLDLGGKGEGTVQFKGIEYDYVLTDENVMVTQGDIAIGELLTWDTASGSPSKDHHVLHGYYNSERDHRWKDAEMCFQVDVDARMFDRMVRDAMAHITTVTGFKFKACRGNRCRDDQQCSRDFVNVQSTPSSCYSYIGRIGGQQPLGVSGQCGLGNVIHVLLHAVGLHHTIDRVDRDDHVRIAWECVPEPKRTNFIIEDANATRAASQDVPYDFFSIMHHPSDAFVHSGGGNNNEKQPPGWCQSVFPIIADVDERLDVLGTMGQRELLAVTDIHAVWKLYPALQDQEKPPTYESVQVDAAGDGDVDTNGGDAQPRAASQNVFESRLHTQEDVTKVDTNDAAMSPGDKRGGRGSRFSQRAASFIGAIVTLFGFGAFVAFAVAEIRKRTLRGSDAYYSESLLTDKSLYD